MSCHLYILHSEKLDKLYLGHTCDLIEERLHKHNMNHKGFMGHSPDWNLVYKEEYKDNKSAYASERKPD